MNQGLEGTTGQLQLRRDFLGEMGPRIYGDRSFVVFGIVLEAPADVTPVDARGVTPWRSPGLSSPAIIGIQQATNSVGISNGSGRFFERSERSSIVSLSISRL